jgi:glycosyltransferase involved in cell wall biosynthesis
MKILHVAESIRGGCGTYLNELVPLQCEALGSQNVRVIAPDAHVAILTDVPESVIVKFRRPGRLPGLLSLLLSLIGEVSRFRPDVIHAHSTFAGAWVRGLALFVPRMPKIIYCPHGWSFYTARTRWARRCMEAAERWQSRQSAAIVAISDTEREAAEAAGIRPEKLVLIRNGLNPTPRVDSRAEWRDARIKALFVGRLDRQKGVDVLLAAMHQLQDSVCVRIVGEAVVGSDERRIGLDNVEYLGWLDHKAVAEQINACDLVVMPSRWEGFPLVAMEAMRAAKPLVASAVGGLKEIVIDTATGRLIPADDVEALVTALRADSSERLVQMGRAGRDRFLAHYAIDKTHAQLLSLYRNVLDRRSEVMA